VPDEVPRLFLAVLADLNGWLDEARIPSMIVGGIAVSLLGRPRATRDIDALAMLPDDQWSSALANAARYGMVARIEDPLEFARRTRVLLLRHERSGIDIDVILGRLPFEDEAIARSKLHDIGGVRVRLPQVEDLLIMKAVARRPQDLRDMEGLLDAHPETNVERVRQWVREFASSLAMPEMLDDLDKLLAQRGPRGR
jgi:predicted nucleotidyltransferase